jgi:hypothetical protein
VQSIVTETLCGGTDLSNPVIVVVDGEVRLATVTAVPEATLFCGARTGVVELVEDVATTD